MAISDRTKYQKKGQRMAPYMPKKTYTAQDVMRELGMEGYEGRSAATTLTRLGKYAKLVEDEDYFKIHRTAIVYTPKGLDKLKKEWAARKERRFKVK